MLLFFSQDVTLDVLGALDANISGILVKTGKCIGVCVVCHRMCQFMVCH